MLEEMKTTHLATPSTAARGGRAGMPGGTTCTVKGANASQCADACQKLHGCAAVSWNQGKDQCCNFKCNARGQSVVEGEEGVIVHPLLNSCGERPPPAPPPAPPSPAQVQL